jgi:hypothetical protein
MKAKFFTSLGITFFILWMVWWNLKTPIPIYFFKVPGLEQHAPHLNLTFYGLIFWTALIVGIPFAVFNIVNRNHYAEQTRRAKKKADRLLEENVALTEQLELLKSVGLQDAAEEEAEEYDEEEPAQQDSIGFRPSTWDTPQPQPAVDEEETWEEAEEEVEEDSAADTKPEEPKKQRKGFGSLMDMIRGKKKKSEGSE